MRSRGALLLLLAWACVPAVATTWGETTVVDPVSGKPCKVPTPASMGSYVYEWPEKYDQVFFPVTDGAGIWTCVSGFAAVIGDIALSAGEKQRIAANLAAIPASERIPKDIAGKLRRAEALYLLRDLAPERPGEGAMTYTATALEIMLARLADESLPPATRMEYAFVSANYVREFGDGARADRLLAQLEALIADSAGSRGESYARYLGSLIASARTIAPGGRLAPEEAGSPAD